MAILKKRAHREKRRKRVRRKLAGTAERPRLSVYRSNVNIYAQLIDDDAARTLAAADSREVGEAENRKEQARRRKAISQLGANVDSEIAVQAGPHQLRSGVLNHLPRLTERDRRRWCRRGADSRLRRLAAPSGFGPDQSAAACTRHTH